MTPVPAHTPSEHAFLVRSVLTRELEYRMSQRAAVENYPAVEEVRAALDSLAALERQARTRAPAGLDELRRRHAWVKEHWHVTGRPSLVCLANDLMAELERIASHSPKEGVTP